MDKFIHRRIIIGLIIVAIFSIFIIQLFRIQILDDSYLKRSLINSQRIIPEYPSRGLIYDRNGILLVENQPVYDLLIVPRQVKVFDTTELLNIINIDKEYLEKQIQKCKRHSTIKSSVVIPQITSDKYAILQEKLHKYEGFYIQRRTFRKYNVNHSSDVFGYIGEVNQKQIDNDKYYTAGDYIGITGLEKTYEEYLRGQKGEKYILVDNHSRTKGTYKGGRSDKQAIVGDNLVLTLDAELQEYAYSLMQNKRGAIIAIEPKTGEILAKVTAPNYDPKLMVGIERGRNYNILQSDPNKPLMDRSIGSSYPPGSTFKILQALYGLKEGIATPDTKFSCIGKARTQIGPIRMGCHHHTSPLDMYEAIQHSCNPYFVQIWRRILDNNKYPNVRDSYAAWHKFISSFGIGQKICPEFSMNETSGLLPKISYYDKVFKTKTWRWSYISSLSIGQGEILTTPLQLANLACIIANKGYYITPHIVKNLIDTTKVYKHQTECPPELFDIAIKGMELAGSIGTAKGAAVDSIQICGKTGTAQNPHGEDHSIFMVYAPKDNPKIAISVYIENGGFGATYAVPIAGLMLEKYLNDSIPDKKRAIEERILKANLNLQQ